MRFTTYFMIAAAAVTLATAPLFAQRGGGGAGVSGGASVGANAGANVAGRAGANPVGPGVAASGNLQGQGNAPRQAKSEGGARGLGNESAFAPNANTDLRNEQLQGRNNDRFRSGPNHQSRGESSVRYGGNDDTHWRYRWHNGEWWYWLPDNRWMIYRNGNWLDYDATTYVVPGDGVSVSPSYGYSEPYYYGGYYYPGYSGYYYYPGYSRYDGGYWPYRGYWGSGYRGWGDGHGWSGGGGGWSGHDGHSGHGDGHGRR